MRIGLFTDTYPPYINGVSTSVLMLKKGLEKLGHTVYVVTVNSESFKYKKEENVLMILGIPVGILVKRYLKVKYNKGNRRDIMETCEIMKADIVDMSKTHMMIQICDIPERTSLLITMLQSVSIVEVARTGTLALPKCSENE